MAVGKRLIDADKLFRAIRDDAEISGIAYTRVKEHIFNAEDEVVHGYWVATPVRKLNSEGKVVKYCDYYHCSECGTDRPIVPPYNYCPNCGAKMDGDGNG